MAFNPSAVTVYVQRCETAAVPPLGPTDCEWVGNAYSLFDQSSFDPQQLELLIAAVILLAAMIFIILMIKKAIQQ